MRNFKFIPILLILFAAFVASDTSADKPVKQVWIENIPWWFNSPCGNDGNGEVVSGSITLKNIRIWKDTGWSGITIPVGEDLVGEDSGEVFRALAAAPGHYNSNGDGANWSINFINHYHGDLGTNVKVFTKLHYTINANGETTVAWNHSSTDCK